MSLAPPTGWRTRDLELELLDAESVELVRLFQHAGMDWDEPPTVHRNERVDPPPGRKDAYAVLYTASSIQCAAVECRVLNVDASDKYTWNETRAAKYEVVRYRFGKPALFIPLDRNRETLGLDRTEVAFSGYVAYQMLALELFERLGGLAHGMSWQSFHRGQPGRAYAVWHHQKAAIDLRITATKPYLKLPADPEWVRFTIDHPGIDSIRA